MAFVHKITFTVSGFTDCPYYQKALAAAKEYSEANPEKVAYEKVEFAGRADFHHHREKILKELGKSVDSHKTCPLVYTTDLHKPRDFIGGCDDFVLLLSTNYKKK